MPRNNDLPYCLNDALDIFKARVIPGYQNHKSALLEKLRAHCMVSTGIRMFTAVKLDDDLPCQTDEIENEISMRMLAAKFLVVDLATAQLLPWARFGVRRCVAQLALALFAADLLVGLSLHDLQFFLVWLAPSPLNPPVAGKGFHSTHRTRLFS